MKICLICPGKLKESYFSRAAEEYSRLIRGFCQFEIIEVPDEQTDREPNLSLVKEGSRILQKISAQDYVITLEIEGRKLDGKSLRNLVINNAEKGAARIVIVIGGSLGLSDEVKKRSNTAVSFSDMTFPHQLMRVILLEQISQWRHY